MESIRKMYGVPCKRGGRVVYEHNGAVFKGTITSSRGDRLRVLLDAYRRPDTFHPLDLKYIE